MVAKARFSMILVLLCLAVLLLQSGCNVSDDAGDPGGGQPSDNIRLTPSTPGNDDREIVADGQDSIPVRVTVTDNTGNGRAGVPVTFVTTAGTLSQAPVAPRAGRANSTEGSTAVPRQEAGEPLTVSTNANGVTEVILTSSTRAETALVTASVPEGFRTSLQVTFFIPLAEVELRATPDQVERNSTATLTAIVTDINGEPVGGEPVAFTIVTNVSGATLSLDTEVTDAEGRAQVTYTAGDTVGVDTLEATTADGTTGTVNIPVVAAEVAAVALSAGATSIVADGISAVRLQATVTDATDAPVPGIAVTFTTTGGSLSSRTATTNDAGIATVDLIAGTTLGSARVTASASGVISTAVSVTFIAGPPETVLLSANPAALSVEQPTTITASVLDSNNNPVADVTLTFAVQPNRSGGTLSNITGTTDANGRLTVTYTAGSTAGTDVVRAVTGSVAGMVSITVTSEGPTGEIASVTLTAGATSIVADGTSSARLRAAVTDEEGTGLSGVEVTFTTTAGSLSASTATTNPQGIAIVNLAAGTNLGTARVTARAGGLISAAVSVMFVAGPPATVVLNANLTTVSAEQTADLVARVTDANNNPVAGETLTFDVSTNVSRGTLSNTTGTTDANGRLAITYMADNIAGTDVVRAETTNDVVGTISITVIITPAEVSTLTVTAGAPSVVADGTSTVGIRAQANDENDDGVPNISVTFATTAGTLSATTAMTDTTGTARVRLTSATNLGMATVTATAAGFSAFTMVMFVSGAPAAILLQATPRFLDATETSELTATVMDANDNPVASETLTFSLSTNASGASLSALSGTTDANGRVTITYTAGSTPGVDTIQAEATNDTQQTVTITVDPTAVAARIDLLVSSPQLDSDGTEEVTLTALVRDVSNNVVEGAEVAFASTAGAIRVQNPVTDASGTTTAFLGTGGERENQVITVTARTGGLTSMNAVTVSGTTITISGASAAILGETVALSLLLRDSGGRGIANATIAVESAQGNPLSAPTVTTDTNGQATVTVTLNAPADDALTAMALGATDDFAIAVSTDNFVFTAPVPTPPATMVLIPLGETREITVHWDDAGTNQVGETINFFATRGTLTATNAVTDTNGNATVSISATNAGPAVITAVAAAPGGPSSQLEVAFIATQPRFLILQADPTTLGVNRGGAPDQQSLITAVVRDAANNLVQSQEVRFIVTEDTTGGGISPSSAITDSFGRATTVYTAGQTPSAQDGVVIEARVSGTTNCNPEDAIPTGPCDQVTLTVAQQALFIRLGTGNTVATPDPTRYAQPYSVLVTDANSNPVAGATVELNAVPTRYQKGFYTLVFDAAGGCIGWGKSLTISPMRGGDDLDQACNNEDRNGNGILNPGEDDNTNGRLDPGNVATVPTSIETDASGFALFDVVYARELTWVEIQLEARATVAGSEAATRATYFLPGLADDFNDCTVAPPGQISPYGTAITCACDEQTDPTCPTRSTLTPVNITPPSTTLFSDRGGSVEFRVSGGSETSYLISSTGGTLSTSTVDFGETFTLEVPSRVGGEEEVIVVTALDLVTGQAGEAEVRLIIPPSVVITPFTRTLAATGGTVSYNVAGGSNTSYTVTADGGTLSNDDGTQSGLSITVIAGETFTLEVQENTSTDTITITLTATDDETGQEGTATVTQLALPPVQITPSTATAIPEGEVIRFSVSGGTQTRYGVSTTGGTLMTRTEVSDTSISLHFGQEFQLIVPQNITDETVTITLIARDDKLDALPLPEAIATITQESSLLVRFEPPSRILPADGGEVFFTVTGGTDTTYTVTIASGPAGATLEIPGDPSQSGTTITVAPEDTFTLSALANSGPGEITIILVAQDNDDRTLPQATAEVTQLAPPP